MNIAARAGRWSAAHWKTATFGWLALVICAVAIGKMVGTVKLSSSEQSIGQSARAQAMLNRAGFHDHASESVLVQSRSLTAAAPSFRAEVHSVVARIGALREVQGIRSPLQAGNRGQISKDGHSALIEFDMRGSPDTASDRVQPVLNTCQCCWRCPRCSAGRSRRAGEPPRSRFRCHELGDAADGDGRQGVDYSLFYLNARSARSAGDGRRNAEIVRCTSRGPPRNGTSARRAWVTAA